MVKSRKICILNGGTMTKLLIINYTQNIEHCGECWNDMEGECALTHTKITEHWKGVQPDCPLEEIVDV